MKKLKIVTEIIRLAILLSIVISGQSFSEQWVNKFVYPSSSIILRDWRISQDSKPSSPLPQISDSLWSPLRIANFSNIAAGNWILSSTIIIENDVKNTPIGLSASGFITAYEIYWDNKLLINNGTLGSTATLEKPGKYYLVINIPAELANKGKHKIILRISNHTSNSSWKWFYGDIRLGEYQELIENIYKNSFQNFVFVGLLLIPFLFNLFLYITRNRKIEHLIFSVICLLVIIDTVLSLVPLLFETDTTYYAIEYFGYRVLTLLVSLLFPTFFIYHLNLKKRLIIPIALIQATIFLIYFSELELYSIMTLSLLILSTLLSGYALIKKLEESVVIFVGILFAWIAYFLNFAFLGLTSVMVISVSFSIAKMFGKQEKAMMDAKLQSVHLQNELLKKNISPHFLLNSLTSIIVWLRKDPGSAIKLILALADEFRMVTQISGEKQITISQEIDLCKSHLKIMSYRKGAEFNLETIDIDSDELIPPMIFHTLIENGITHGYESKESGLFTIARVKTVNSIRYIIKNNGDFANEESVTSTGFGLKYIRGRLEESYPGKWVFTSSKVDDGWESIIEIRDSI